MPATFDDRVAELETANAGLSQKLDACAAELKAARERQQAANAVLEAMSRSPGDMRPVFEAIVESATRLCQAEFTAVARFEGGLLHLVAVNNLAPEEGAAFHRLFPRPALRDFAMGRSFLDGKPVQFADVLAEPGYDTRTLETLQSVIQYRSFLGVPILREGRPIGVIGCGRREVRPVADAEIAILQTFADQAAIALENTRLLAETREALDQQTATAEVLQIINSSPGDLAPVFEAMLDKATRLCDAASGVLWVAEAERFRAVVSRGLPARFEEFLRTPVDAGPDTGIGRLARGERFAHIADTAAASGYRSGDPLHQAAVDLGGIRSLLAVPLRKDGALIGAFGITRLEVRPFSEKQIALVENFAAQAVIAMENARLLTETREALEQQTATAEVLGVINESPGDLAPVFDAMLEKAMRLCEASHGHVWRFDGEQLHAVAARGDPRFVEWLHDHSPVRPIPGSAAYRIAQGERLVHLADRREEDAYRDDPVFRGLVDESGVRASVSVALRKDEILLGMINVYRQEVRPFTDKQIALLQNFAAQAVIAMENARLITETREALAQQTATAEVLQVINSSPGDLAPVFDAMLDKAMRLCGVDHAALELYHGERFHAVAVHGASDRFADMLRQGYRAADSPASRTLLEGGRFVQIADAAQIDLFTSRAAAELDGIRTVLFVPLRRDDVLLGMIASARREVRPFSEKEIALLENFAAQAVIAMENARLLGETREALEQQTATAEVLGVINESPGDLAPIFDAMLDKAMRLCGAEFGEFFITEGDRLRAVGSRGTPAAFAEFRRRNPAPPSPGSITARILAGEPFIHVADVKDDDLYRHGNPHRRALVDLGGARAFLSVTLLKDRAPLGSINIYRQEVRPFTEKQVALLQNFAAQAVIAMENARLLNELRERTHDLEESLEYQTATSEVLQVISRSTFDLQPVLTTVVDTAARLCDAGYSAILRRDGEVYRMAAAAAFSPEEVNAAREYQLYLEAHPLVPGRGSITGRVALEGRAVHIADITADAEYTLAESATLGNLRTLLGVPLLREGSPIGVICLGRQRVEPFTERQIELVRTFADQAAIAIENTRLLTETREALEQQTATAEVLQVINSSPGDLAPVFDAMLEKATELCEAAFGILWVCEAGKFHAAALHGTPAAYAEIARIPVEPRPDNPLGRMLRGERLIVSTDVSDEEPYRAGDPVRRALVDLAGARSVIQVALVKDDALLGSLTVYRREVRPFSDKQIALLQNFAAQAVIAMENARLLSETREALEQQTATAEILQVINASPGDLAPVFEAILEKGHQLCGIPHGSLQLYDGEKFSAVAVHGLSGALADRLREGYAPGPTYPVWRVLKGERVVHTPDLAEIDDPLARSVVALGGARTLLWVALRRDDKLFGLIAAARLEVRPFSEKEIALLESFAAQAVIAMDNARLLEEIRRRQAELRVTFDNMGDGVAMFDAGMTLAAWNRNFQQMLDLPDEFVAARPSYAEYARYLAERGEFGPADVEAEVGRLMQVVGTRGSLERTRPDGRVVEVRYNPAPDGGFVLIYGDVTERKHAEAEIRAARDAAEKALGELKTAQASLVHAEKMASLGQLTAGIAHEIKNPLNFVNNFAGLSVELLDELKEAAAPAVASLGDDMRAEIDELVETLSGNLGKIVEHGRRADGIVTSMLAHSRGSSGERERVDLNALVEEALNLAYHGARAQDQDFNIAMERAFEPGLAPIEIVPQDLTRVFLNLFGNGFYAARKRARETGYGFRPMLGVATRDLGDAVEIRVRDNGAGIPPELRDRLFQPFFTTKPTGEGTGLGLSISYDIVTQGHGGAISVESEPGRFTEFTVRLPRRAHAV